MSIPSRTIVAGLAALIFAAGCSSQQTTPAEAEVAFGDVVRGVMNAQIHDYDAAINPNPEAVDGSDPYLLNNVVTTYREHISKPEEVSQPLEISVGGN